jgi:type II secretory pathway component PulF
MQEASETMSYILFFVLLWVALAVVGVMVYLIPSIVAFKLGHPWRWLILAANVLGGWTVLGWFALLILILVSARELERRKWEGRSSPLAPFIRGFTRASTIECPDCEAAYLSGKDVCLSCGREL